MRTTMFRRRKAAESERSPNSSSTRPPNTNNNSNDDGLWFRKAAHNNKHSSDATNVATASLVHMAVSSSPERRSTTNTPTTNRDSYRNSYTTQRGQDDDDESTQRPSETTKRPSETTIQRAFIESGPSSSSNKVAQHNPSSSSSSPPKKTSSLKGGDLIALIVCEEWEQAIKALDDNPKVARMPQPITLDGLDSQGLPLHLAACSRPPFRFVEKLLQAFPDASKTPDELTGRLPLHWACICRASVSILKLLLDHYPSALASLDTFEGRLPLHYACLYGSPEVVELLVTLEKRAVVYKDTSGLTPLDLIEKARNNPHREENLKLLENAKVELEKAKLKRQREREKAAAAAIQELPPTTPRKMPPMPSKDLPTPNISNVASIPRPNLKSDWSVHSEFDNAPSVDLQSASPSLMTSPNIIGPNRKRTSLRTLLNRVGGGNNNAYATKSPPTASLQATSPRATAIPSPQDDATGVAVAGSPWSSRPNGSGAATYNRSSAAAAMQRANTQGRFSQQSLPDQGYGIVDTSRPSLPEPPLVRGRSAFDGKSQSESYIPVAKAPPTNHQNNYGFDGNSPGSAARDEVFSSYARELSVHRQKLAEKDTELSALDAQVRQLELRRQVLLDECQNAETSVLEKQKFVERKQQSITRLKSQLAQLQAELEAEEAALELAESSLMVNRETLVEHEQKMRTTEEEKNSLSAIRESVMDQKREIHRNVSNLEAEMKSLETIHDRT